MEDFDSASRAARHLTQHLFEPIEARVAPSQRVVVQTVRAEFLRLLLQRLRRAADANFPPMRDILEQTARVDLLGSPFGSTSKLDEATHQAYREAVAGIAEKSLVRHKQSEVLNQMLKDPDAFAADSEATHFSLPALDSEGRPLEPAEETEDEVFEAELAGEDDSGYGMISSADIVPAVAEEAEDDAERSFDLDQDEAEDTPEPDTPQGMSVHDAKRLQMGERLIRNTSAILFDLIRNHCEDSAAAAVHRVESAFVRTCVERLRQAIEGGEDPKIILKQLMAINPVRIRVAALGNLDASVGMQFREAVSPLETSRTYANQLQNARKVFSKHPDVLLSSDSPKTYNTAVRLLAGTAGPPTSRTAPTSRGGVGAPASSQKIKAGEAAMEVTTHSGVTVIRLRNASYMGQSEIRRLEGELAALIRGESKPRVVINFSRVERISSAFIGVIFALNKLVRTQSGQLRLAELREPVAQVFDLTGVPKLIKVHKSTAEAVSALI